MPLACVSLFAFSYFPFQAPWLEPPRRGTKVAVTLRRHVVFQKRKEVMAGVGVLEN